jgi:hypothetical protein
MDRWMDKWTDGLMNGTPENVRFKSFGVNAKITGICTKLLLEYVFKY